LSPFLPFFYSNNGGRGGVQLDPLGALVTNWPIVRGTGEYEVGEFSGMMIGGETEVLGENLPQYHLVHHKSHMTWSGANPGRRGGWPATNRLSYGTASILVYFDSIFTSSFVCLFNDFDL
jgi:hypothetical protein